MIFPWSLWLWLSWIQIPEVDKLLISALTYESFHRVQEPWRYDGLRLNFKRCYKKPCGSGRKISQMQGHIRVPTRAILIVAMKIGPSPRTVNSEVVEAGTLKTVLIEPVGRD